MREGLLWAGALGAAINGGVFFAFSALTMPGLDRLAAGDARGAVVAMQAINEVAVRPPLMIVLFGTTLATLGAAAVGIAGLPSPAGWLALAGSATFLVGVTALTIGYHVPLNDTLAAVGADDDPTRAWAAFSPRWTIGNHIRAGAGIVAAGLLAAATRFA